MNVTGPICGSNRFEWGLDRIIAEGNNISNGQEIERVCALVKGRLSRHQYQAKIEAMKSTLGKKHQSQAEKRRRCHTFNMQL